MKAASIVNEAYCVEQRKRLRKQLKPIAFILIETIVFITRRTKMQYSTWHQCMGNFLCPSAQNRDGTTHS